jgi:hypothetical protein
MKKSDEAAGYYEIFLTGPSNLACGGYEAVYKVPGGFVQLACEKQEPPGGCFVAFPAGCCHGIMQGVRCNYTTALVTMVLSGFDKYV